MTVDPNDKKIESIRASHKARPAPEPSQLFEQNVMRRVRAEVLDKESIELWDLFQPAVWKFAGAAACLTLVLGMATLPGGFTPELEVAELAIEAIEANDD